jgi:hypothetical protein
MRITKRQLRRIIREYGTRHRGAGAGASAPSPEYDRGFQDGYDGMPRASDADTDYDAGYEDGQADGDADAERDYEMGYR